MRKGKSVRLDPSDYVEIIDIIDNARRRIYNNPDNDECAGVDREHSPRSLAEYYGGTERNIVRALAKGRDHYRQVIQRRLGETYRSIALRPEKLDDCDLDFLMYELQTWLDDEGSYKDFYTSPVVIRRCPSVRQFRSLTQLRQCYRAWREEYQDLGIGNSRARSQAEELLHGS